MVVADRIGVARRAPGPARWFRLFPRPILRRVDFHPRSRWSGKRSRPVKDERKELIMTVDGIARAGGAEAVTKAIRRLDPSAEVEVDLTHGRITVATYAQALEVAEALGKAGYEAKAMTL